ncbi:hypothetical protein F2Q68_00027953 [Brassica cretica]|uniref:Thioredoxin domain-containing protein n=1 Tax=Brassica cretica TaxID=69181 RepID=A0A8S9IFX2_BRACR|nr:hypothetical protein F2Q68_00027953 [Brassica cretica]
MKGSFSIVRQVFQRRFSTLRSSRPSALSGSARSLIASPSSTPSQIPRNSSLPASAFVSSSIASNFSTTCFPSTRSLCSSAGGGNGVVIVKSEEEFINAMSKAEGGSSPSIFYFTAVWCGPCRFIAPVIEELSKQYPDVTTYKIDIDEVCSTIRAPGALKSPSLTSCISVNASVVASVFVASRLPSRRQVFLFAPLVTYCIKKFSFGLHLLFSFGLIGLTLDSVYALHILFFVLFLVIVVVVNVVCPYWLIRMQEYKFEINGLWDEAKLCFYITD